MITWTPELIPIFEINLPVRFAPQTPSSESRVPGKVLQKEWPSFLLTMERRDKDSNDRMQNWRLQIMFWVVGRVVTHPVTNCVTAAPSTWQLDYARCTMSLCFHVLPGEAQLCIALKHRGETIQIEPARLTISFQNGNKIRLWQTRCKHDELSCNAVLCSLKGLFGDLFRCLWKWTSRPLQKNWTVQSSHRCGFKFPISEFVFSPSGARPPRGHRKTANKRLNLEQPANLQGS